MVTTTTSLNDNYSHILCAVEVDSNMTIAAFQHHNWEFLKGFWPLQCVCMCHVDEGSTCLNGAVYVVNLTLSTSVGRLWVCHKSVQMLSAFHWPVTMRRRSMEWYFEESQWFERICFIPWFCGCDHSNTASVITSLLSWGSKQMIWTMLKSKCRTWNEPIACPWSMRVYGMTHLCQYTSTSIKNQFFIFWPRGHFPGYCQWYFAWCSNWCWPSCFVFLCLNWICCRHWIIWHIMSLWHFLEDLALIPAVNPPPGHVW